MILSVELGCLGLIAGAVWEHLDELNEKVRWSLAFTGFGLVGDFDSTTTDLTTLREKVAGPITEVPDRIVQSWELAPVFDALAADLSE